jgi:putative transposase
MPTAESAARVPPYLITPLPPCRNAMPNYRRSNAPGASWFFTVNLLRRRDNDLLTQQIALLREAFSRVRRTRPFAVLAWVVLPEHMHWIWRLPEGDHDFSTRWRLIRRHFSLDLPADERRSAVRHRRGERGIWQRRFWEHQLRGEEDFARHADYIHYNPVEHGWVERPADWPHSSFREYVRRGVYPLDWGGADGPEFDAGE